MTTPRPAIVLYGPTASGKSSLAIALAQEFEGVVINADSMQVYRDLRVLTDRPSPVEEAEAPHRLYGVLDGSEIFSAARWREMALTEIRAAHQVDRLPILCGGTGFYFKALLDGLSPMPEIPGEIRDQVRQEVAMAGDVKSWERLQRIDPEAADRIEPTDRQRITRALEVFEATGDTLSDWRRVPLDGPPSEMRFMRLALDPPREVLK